MIKPPEGSEAFRKRAAETRAIAERAIDPGTKRMLISIAETYEELAERAKARASR